MDSFIEKQYEDFKKVTNYDLLKDYSILPPQINIFKNGRLVMKAVFDYTHDSQDLFANGLFNMKLYES